MARSIRRLNEIVEYVRSKNLDAWTPGYARWWAGSILSRSRAALGPSDGPRHLLFTFCDHFEPLWSDVSHAQGVERVRAWSEGYPALTASFRDSDGRPPRHSFFFPGEQYSPDFLEPLAVLARKGLGEVEFHLHHEDDTSAGLRRSLDEYLRLFAQHGHLARDPDGRLRYAFIHGNWCLANARRDGKKCGVADELPILHDTGCYADFTFPSAPDESQPAIVNRIYWPEGDLSRRRAYEQGSPARVGERRHDRILMIEGPLSFALWPNRWHTPRIENAAVTAFDPGTPSRVRSWVRQRVGVVGQPNWVFVKVHTHGAPEKQGASLLGEGGRTLHTELTTRYNDGKRWRLHYLTAREMYNVALAAMDGRTGDPAAFRDYVLSPPPVVTA